MSIENIRKVYNRKKQVKIMFNKTKPKLVFYILLSSSLLLTIAFQQIKFQSALSTMHRLEKTISSLGLEVNKLTNDINQYKNEILKCDEFESKYHYLENSIENYINSNSQNIPSWEMNDFPIYPHSKLTRRDVGKKCFSSFMGTTNQNCISNTYYFITYDFIDNVMAWYSNIDNLNVWKKEGGWNGEIIFSKQNSKCSLRPSNSDESTFLLEILNNF